MILVLSPDDDAMGRVVAEALGERNADFIQVSVHDLPGSIKLRLTASGKNDALIFADGELPLAEVTAVYHRVGFSDFEVFEEFDKAEVEFVNNECQCALVAWLDTFQGLVVNRPAAAASNASKPFQIRRVAEYGFLVPSTIVTNMPASARSFCDDVGGATIFKSISYHRSVVQKMSEHDVERLELLKHCPVQLQAYVPGVDIRVHVVGDRGVFASRIDSTASDYRYDRKTEVVPTELPGPVAEQCVRLTRGLGLELSGIDLRRTPDGQFCCFEVNPAPAFEWYERQTGQPISGCIADHLLGPSA